MLSPTGSILPPTRIQIFVPAGNEALDTLTVKLRVFLPVSSVAVISAEPYSPNVCISATGETPFPSTVLGVTLATASLLLVQLALTAGLICTSALAFLLISSTSFTASSVYIQQIFVSDVKGCTPLLMVNVFSYLIPSSFKATDIFAEPEVLPSTTSMFILDSLRSLFETEITLVSSDVTVTADSVSVPPSSLIISTVRYPLGAGIPISRRSKEPPFSMVTYPSDSDLLLSENKVGYTVTLIFLVVEIFSAYADIVHEPSLAALI